KSRVLVAAAGLSFGLLMVWARVAWLQVVRHAYYAGRAEMNQEQRVLLRPARGRLLARDGRVLARDVPTYSVSAAPKGMSNPRLTARALAALLAEDPRRMERSFATRPRFLWVKRRISPEI